jgi:hypothetical protein
MKNFNGDRLCKIEFVSNQYFLFKMIEQVNYDNLIEGQTYYVVQKKGLIEGDDMIYHGNSFFRYWNSIHTFQIHKSYFNFYRYVSKDEYYIKLKEKYDQTSLDIVLKRLVNENFQW